MGASACVLIGYFTGTINPAYILSRIKGFDIRTRGSGNAGATNSFLTMGKIFGILCALVDIFKGFLAFRFAKYVFPHLEYAGMLAGASCILGHIFPIWLGFRGGKGLACIAGMVLAFNWKVFLGLLVFEIALTLAVDYICVMAMSLAVIVPVVYVWMTCDLIGTIALLLVGFVVECKHMDNIQRIREGSELHLSFLWNKEAEIVRVMEALGEDRTDELA